MKEQTDIKDSAENYTKKEFISRLDTAEEMSEIEVRTIEIISTETQRGNSSRAGMGEEEAIQELCGAI